MSHLSIYICICEYDGLVFHWPCITGLVFRGGEHCLEDVIVLLPKGMLQSYNQHYNLTINITILRSFDLTMIQSYNHSILQSFNLTIIQSGLSHWLRHGLVHCLVHWLSHWLSHGLVHWLVHWLSHWLSHWLVHWLSHGLQWYNVPWIVMFIDIDYWVLFAHGLVRFVDSCSLGGELTRLHWYIAKTFLLTCFATGYCVMQIWLWALWWYAIYDTDIIIALEQSTEAIIVLLCQRREPQL